MESNPRPPLMAESIPTSTEAPPPPPRPLPTTVKRSRRRAREVSSRYMTTPSPMVGSSSPAHSSSLFQNQKHQWSPSIPSSPDATDSESESLLRFADENQPPPPAACRSSETPLVLGSVQSKSLGTQRRRAVKLFGENGSGDHHHHQPEEHPKRNSRKPSPGTPMVYPVDRISTSKGATFSHTHLRLVNLGATIGRKTVAKGSRSEVFPPSRAAFRGDEKTSENSCIVGDSKVETCSISSQGGFCDSPPISGLRVRQVSEFRSSMPEADILPSTSVRRILDGVSGPQKDGNDINCRPSSSSLCYRSLNLAHLGSQTNPFNSTNPIGKSTVQSKICLPPQPPSTKFGVEIKKGKKGLGRQEDVHMLRLLDNRYLQWRFVNAKAQEAVDARRLAAEKSLYGLSAKLSEMQTSVIQKKIELEDLKRMRNLSSILECQMPYLDEWTMLEGDYSSSLSGATKAVQDALLRLPITSNVRADIRELKEVLNSSTNMLEFLSPCVQRFLPKAEGIEDVISDLARLVSTERTLLEECGNLLSEAHKLQVKECSLRSQLIQEKQSTSM